MQKWVKWSEKQAANIKSKRKESDEEAHNYQDDSKLELNSSLDVSIIRNNTEIDSLHPRKTDNTAIQKFKISMLKSYIKPVSWKKQQAVIQKTQKINEQRAKNYEQHMQRNEAQYGPDREQEVH